MRIFIYKEFYSRFKVIVLIRALHLTVSLLFIGLFQVSASTYAQKINLNGKNISVKKVFDVIRQQTGLAIIYQSSQFNSENKIDVSFHNAGIPEVMDLCLSGESLSYIIEDKSIVIRPKIANATLGILQDSVIFKGKVLDQNGLPMSGATIRQRGVTKNTITDKQGQFRILVSRRGILMVSFLGYQNREITLFGLDPSKELRISMVLGENNLGEVNVVSTGYQDIPKERATGSFEVITKEQLQHSTDPNLLRRLEGITTSMNFNNRLTPNNSSIQSSKTSPLVNLTIRGKNTLNQDNVVSASGQVLIVIDGIPAPYPTDKDPYLLDLINPNDVESVTILKDAAAASIWGSRAANGVIVIKTKKGHFSQPASVTFNSNLNITEKLDLFYKRFMSVSDFIDAEIRRFTVNNRTINPPTLTGAAQALLSPVEEILNSQRRGLLTADQANAQIDALRGNDLRRDYDKYLLRNSIRQSYSLAIDGGSLKMTYRLSAGYDKTLNNTVGSSGDRINLSYMTSLRPIKNLELNGTVSYTLALNNDRAPYNRLTGVSNVGSFAPYAKFSDDQGNPLVVPFLYRPVYLDLLESTYGSKILNLRYSPLDELTQGFAKSRTQNLNLSVTGNYKLLEILKGSLTYSYNTGRNFSSDLASENSFYMRNLINVFTNKSTFERVLPVGGLYQERISVPETQTLRGQFNLDKDWGNKHSLSAILGMEIGQTYSKTSSNNYLGYNEDNLNSVRNLNYQTLYPTFFNSFAFLPAPLTPFSDFRVRTISAFSNAAYTYKRRYTVSASLRKDGSSLYGSGVNKTGTPFWSVGSSWNISNESFYHFAFLPILQLRATFGYNGNVNPSVTADPQVVKSTDTYPSTGLLYAILNTAATGLDASNSLLRPEKTGVLNLGLDFGSRNSRISGSIEFYDKRTSDLLADSPINPTTGFSRLKYNVANLHGWGWDLNLRSLNMQIGQFQWRSNFLFSYNRVKVTKLYDDSEKNVSRFIQGSGFSEGDDLSRSFAFAWGGLDPLTGDPRGILNGQPISLSATSTGTVIQALLNAPAASSTLKYMGSSVPTYYGSFRNTVSYGRISISANILYKFGYVFTRNDQIRYSDLFTSKRLQSVDYQNRWQKPGDEVNTNIPSLTFPVNSDRDGFYELSEMNILKGDHVRLQEINISYTISKRNWFIKNPRFYANINNLGIIWRANKLGIDPEANDYPNPRTYGFGLSANF